MLDGSDKKTIINVSGNPSTFSWDSFSQEMFAKCLQWPEGSLYTPKNLAIESKNLSDIINTITYFELTSFEARDLIDFFESYLTKIAIIETGPGKPNGFRLKLHPKSEPLYEMFARIARELITNIQEDLRSIEFESRTARTRHDSGLDQNHEKSEPRIKRKLAINDETKDLLDIVERIGSGLTPYIQPRNRPPDNSSSPGRSHPTGTSSPSIPFERAC